jgi:hypothetical protein
MRWRLRDTRLIGIHGQGPADTVARWTLPTIGDLWTGIDEPCVLDAGCRVLTTRTTPGLRERCIATACVAGLPGSCHEAVALERGHGRSHRLRRHALEAREIGDGRRPRLCNRTITGPLRQGERLPGRLRAQAADESARGRT